MSDQWTDRLSEYLDGELAEGERQMLEVHLEICTNCRTVLDDLGAVLAHARSVSPRAPQHDLWPAIQSRLGERSSSVWSWRTRQWTLSFPQLAAASLAFIVIGGSAAWMLRSMLPALVPIDRSVARTEPAVSSEAAGVVFANFADPQYDAAVTDLQKALRDGRGRLDPRTIDVLEKNLAVIDQAIEQARQAVRADPANTYLNSYLADARRRKLALLREAAQLADVAS